MNLRQIIITLIVILLFTPKLGYINANSTTGTDITNGVEIVRTMTHEQEHANGGNEAQSDIVGDAAARQMAIENWFGGYETGGTQAERDNYVQQNSTDLGVRSGAASNVEYGDAFVESGWDAANLAMDAASLANNLKNKNYSGAAIDAAAGILDLAALAIPAIPGGAGTAVKAARGVEVADDFVAIAKRADQVSDLLLPETQVQRLLPQPKAYERNPNIEWPENGGFQEAPIQITLNPGDRIDRYGFETGTYTSPEGTPFDMRSLPQEYINSEYNSYVVQKPISNVNAGLATPSFGQPGNGIQYELPDSVQNLKEQGYLK